MIFSLAILAIVLGYTWVIDPIAPASVAPAPVVLVLGLTIWHAARSGDWGVKMRALVPALWRSGVLTAVAGLGIYAAGAALHTWQIRRDPWPTLALLIPWGLGQQIALQTVFLREAQAAAGRSAGIVIAAALFAALHLPNPFLTMMTFAGALAWCWIYERAPNVLPLGLSHALLTLAILFAFDDAITGRLRVGISYLSR